MKKSRFNTGSLLVFQELLLATVRYWWEGRICISEQVYGTLVFMLTLPSQHFSYLTSFLQVVLAHSRFFAALLSRRVLAHGRFFAAFALWPQLYKLYHTPHFSHLSDA